MDKTKLPGYMQELPSFDPHIASFECQTEASKVPPVDAQADDWFLEARAMEDGFVYVDDVDYKKVVQLTRQAAERHHWKAMLNLASLYVEGRDPPHGESEAVALVLQAIELGIPRDDMISVLDYGGMPLTAKVVVEAVMKHKSAQNGNGRPGGKSSDATPTATTNATHETEVTA